MSILNCSLLLVVLCMIETGYVFLKVVLKTLLEEYEIMVVVHHLSTTWAPFVHFKFDAQKFACIKSHAMLILTLKTNQTQLLF